MYVMLVVCCGCNVRSLWVSISFLHCWGKWSQCYEMGILSRQRVSKICQIGQWDLEKFAILAIINNGRFRWKKVASLLFRLSNQDKKPCYKRMWHEHNQQLLRNSVRHAVLGGESNKVSRPWWIHATMTCPDRGSFLSHVYWHHL